MRAILVLVLVVFSLSANAADVAPSISVGAFLTSCESATSTFGDIPEGGAACVFYMGAIADSFTSHLYQPFACSTEDANLWSVVHSFVSWAQANPDQHNEDVFRGVIAALKQDFPCR